MSFKAAPEDFPQKHKATILNIGIAETGTQRSYDRVNTANAVTGMQVV